MSFGPGFPTRNFFEPVALKDFVFFFLGLAIPVIWNKRHVIRLHYRQLPDEARSAIHCGLLMVAFSPLYFLLPRIEIAVMVFAFPLAGGIAGIVMQLRERRIYANRHPHPWRAA